MASRRGGRRVVNGRLVDVDKETFVLSVPRLIFFALLGAFLWTTNPANAPYTVHASLGLEHPYARPTVKGGRVTHRQVIDAARITNFGLFSTRRLDTQVQVSLGGVTWTCSTSSETYRGAIDHHSKPETVVCHLVRQYLCHGKPLVVDPKDRPYTTHRILLWTASGIAVLNLAAVSGTLRIKGLNGLLNILVYDPYDAPIGSVIDYIVESNWFLVPVYQRMDELIRLQSKASYFRVFDTDRANYVWSVAAFWISAMLCVNIVRLCFARLPRRTSLDVTVALAIGYLRGASWHQAMDQWAPALADWLFPSAAADITTTGLTWMIFLASAAVSGNPFPAMMAWFGANTVGFHLGQYQFRHQIVVHHVKSFWKSLLFR